MSGGQRKHFERVLIIERKCNESLTEQIRVSFRENPWLSYLVAVKGQAVSINGETYLRADSFSGAKKQQ